MATRPSSVPPSPPTAAVRSPSVASPSSPSPTHHASTSRTASASTSRTARIHKTHRGAGGARTARRKTLADKAKKPKPMRAVTKAELIVRTSHKQKSKRAGKLLVGSVVYVFDVRERDGMLRAKVGLRDNAAPAGWVTVARDGELFLDMEGGLEAISASPDPSAKSGLKASAKFTYASVADLNLLMERQLRLADAADADAVGTGLALPARLGEALHARAISVNDYVAKCSKSGSQITKMEFRKSVRDLGLAGTTGGKEIDDLFDSIDLDKGGSLDPAELKAAWQKLKDQAKLSAELREVSAERAAKLRKHAAATKRAVDATAEAEAAQEKLNEIRTHTSVDVRLGNLLVKRGIKIGDLMLRWDENQDGSLDRKEFQTNLRALGLEATNDELDAFITDNDADGSGEFDMAEVGVLLRKLQDACAAAANDEKHLLKRASDLKKLATQAQMAAYREAEAEELEAANDAPPVLDEPAAKPEPKASDAKPGRGKGSAAKSDEGGGRPKQAKGAATKAVAAAAATPPPPPPPSAAASATAPDGTSSAAASVPAAGGSRD